ncbi:hypothetical protein MXD95_001475 [Frankia sp. AiPa1]|nr:hypothetical protein [Frankia sp. AiPa1]
MGAVWGTEPELLVVLTQPGDPSPDVPPDAADSRRDRGAGVRDVATFGRITSTLPPRLVLLAAPASRARELAALPGVRAVCVDDVPWALRAVLDPAETIFVDGWLARHTDKSRGESDGIPWDAPGFQPPDPTAR